MKVNVKQTATKAIEIGGKIILYAITGLAITKVIKNYDGDDIGVSYSMPNTASNATYSEGYSDAIAAISKSDINDYYKSMMIKEVRTRNGKEYYDSIISIVSVKDMSDYYKYDAIRNLNRKRD